MIARAIVIALLLVLAGWVFYTMIYSNLKRNGK
jgi:heme O synthase-like polyprenyltransferase